jgi:hypothetical protein
MVFHMLMGPEWRIGLQAVYDSTARMVEYTSQPCLWDLFREAQKCPVKARCAFIALLVTDETLRAQVVEGKCPLPSGLTSLQLHPLDAHKAERLFLDMGEHAVDPWARHELNSPVDLVRSFERLYLLS